MGLDLRYLKVNRKFCEIVGYSEDEILQMTVRDITHEDDLEDNLKNDKKVTNSDGKETSFSMRKRYVRKDKKIVWVDLQSQPFFDKGNKPIYFVSQVMDITHRVQLEESLLESERKLKQKTRFVSQLES